MIRPCVQWPQKKVLCWLRLQRRVCYSSQLAEVRKVNTWALPTDMRKSWLTGVTTGHSRTAHLTYVYNFFQQYFSMDVKYVSTGQNRRTCRSCSSLSPVGPAPWRKMWSLMIHWNMVSRVLPDSDMFCDRYLFTSLDDAYLYMHRYLRDTGTPISLLKRGILPKFLSYDAVGKKTLCESSFCSN